MAKYIIILGVILGLTACKIQNEITPEPQKTILITKPKPTDSLSNSTAQFLTKIPKEVNFSQLKIKGNAELNIETTVPRLGITLYFEKNNKIWTNVTVLGMTSARGLITKDSIKGYEKLNKTYIKSNFDDLQDLIGLDFLDFQNTENLCLGKLFMPIDVNNFGYTNKTTTHTLITQKPIEIKSSKSKGNYTCYIVFDSNFELQSVFLNDEQNKKSWKIEYSERELFSGKNFPKKVKIFINDSKNKEIILDYNTFEFEKMSISFDIPSNYTKRKI